LKRAFLLTIAALLSASCGGDSGTDVAVYPDFAGSWQFRSFLSQGTIVCTENAELTVSQASGSSSFSGSASITTDCFEDLDHLASWTETVPVSDGVFGEETARGSWSIVFSARPGWSYTGEAFISVSGEIVVQGNGSGTLDPGNGEPMPVSFPWTICRRFRDQADAVERGCA
jgi:hypothetical protein